MKGSTLFFLSVTLFCQGLFADENKRTSIQVQALPDMPLAITNNAVALLPVDGGFEIYSFLGLESGKTWADASRAAMRYTSSSQAGSWTHLPQAPGDQGRLAASAVTANGEIYLFGGYTVASDGGEQSTFEVYRLDRNSGQLEIFSTMPVPVEDSVVAVYADRWVYLVSGWHDVGNVNLVQVLDVVDKNWSQATPFPGQPVFGHAGGITGTTLVICDGVRIAYQVAPEPRKFLPSEECWKGTIDSDNHRRIDWRRIEHHPGMSLYRMAAGNAAGNEADGRIWFAGGSDNPYNFNGVGYDGIPSEPERGVFSFDVSSDRWQSHGALSEATMDHRGLLYHDGWFYIVGGMRAGQQVSKGALRFKPE